MIHVDSAFGPQWRIKHYQAFEIRLLVEEIYRGNWDEVKNIMLRFESEFRTIDNVRFLQVLQALLFCTGNEQATGIYQVLLKSPKMELLAPHEVEKIIQWVWISTDELDSGDEDSLFGTRVYAYGNEVRARLALLIHSSHAEKIPGYLLQKLKEVYFYDPSILNRLNELYKQKVPEGCIIG